MPKIKPRSSRRASPLKDADYDHEITLVDSAADDEETGTAASAANDTSTDVVEVAAEGRSGQSFEAPPTNPAIGSGDAAVDDNASHPPAPSAHPVTVAALSPIATASSTTPLLNSLPAAPAPVSASTSGSRASSPPRGRPTSRYGSIPKVMASPPDTAPLDRVAGELTTEDAVSLAPRPASRLTNFLAAAATPEAGASDSATGKGKQQQQQPCQLPVAAGDQPGRPSMQSSIRTEPDAVIDILYENQRGGFLCGIPLFSGQALGNLDPSPWTNVAQKTSPTDINTAQVPDPSWEWAWPEWRINHDEGVDEDGWQYSFMFSKYFSWHGPTWYSSFVRRRVWIRKRVKRKLNAAMSAAASATGLGEIDNITDPHLLNPEYFTVMSAASMRRSSSRASSRLGSRLSVVAPSIAETSRSGRGSIAGDAGDVLEDGEGGRFFEMPSEIEDADVLMRFLRAARIDREKIEAVDNFIRNAGEDLVRLQDCMHEIMALFVFQASRRTLLTHLIKAHDAAVADRQTAIDEAETNGDGEEGTEKQGKATAGDETEAQTAKEKKAVDNKKEDAGAEGDVIGEATEENEPPRVVPAVSEATAPDTVHRLQALGRRVGYLTAAVKHADEEVRRLEYWSDIKAMAQRGDISGAVGKGDGWDAKQWQGIDKSGPAAPPPPPAGENQPPTKGSSRAEDDI